MMASPSHVQDAQMRQQSRLIEHSLEGSSIMPPTSSFHHGRPQSSLAGATATCNRQACQYTTTPVRSRPTTMMKMNLGSKDLIIRMLAEVFKVSRSEETGQLRWRQVSSSLVPVSLYSRTTSRWLDYLTVASSITSNQKQSAMSPDSRHLLLLLQQFHQQTRSTIQQSSIETSTTNALDIEQNNENSTIVFQVVAHDFNYGECKTILNAKIFQPGTRLGQASDYFVYWRERDTSKPSCQCMSTVTNPNQPQFDQIAQSCCPIEATKTWGLNFASINDANLFYDICSLNLVDLDFNSDYLRLLALSDRNQPHQIRNYHRIPIDETSLGRNYRSYQEQQQQQFQARQSTVMDTRYSRNQFPASQTDPMIYERNCAACQEIEGDWRSFRSHDQQQQLHGQCLQYVQAYQQHRPIKPRIRSRSSTRPSRGRPMNLEQPVTFRGRTHSSEMSHKRSQSFSTPSSPKKEPNSEVNSTTFRNLPIKQPSQGSNWINTNKPMKPARGVLRSSDTQDEHLEEERNQQLRPELSSKESQSRISSFGEMVCDVGGSRNEVETNFNNVQDNDRDFEDDTDDENNNEDDVGRQARMFASSRMQTRRATGVDSSNVRQFADEGHRTARLARAQYAQSKMMKEFLSLDVANCNMSPRSYEAIRYKERRDQPIEPRESPKRDTDGDIQREVATNTEALSDETRQLLEVNQEILEKEAKVSNQQGSEEFDSKEKNESCKKSVELCSYEDSGQDSLARQEAGTKSTRNVDSSTRRRSLERTNCVDFDTPARQRRPSMIQQGRLSPLAQSMSSPVSLVADENRSNEVQRKTRQVERVSGRRIRTKSSGESGSNYQHRSSGYVYMKQAGDLHEQYQQQRHRFCPYHQYLTKSAPDIRSVMRSSGRRPHYLDANNDLILESPYSSTKLRFNPLNSNARGTKDNNLGVLRGKRNQGLQSSGAYVTSCYVNEQQRQSKQEEIGANSQILGVGTRGSQNYQYQTQFSSYAIPLCWDKRQLDSSGNLVLDNFEQRNEQELRKYHSCPNSLRRGARYDYDDDHVGVGVGVDDDANLARMSASWQLKQTDLDERAMANDIWIDHSSGRSLCQFGEPRGGQYVDQANVCKCFMGRDAPSKPHRSSYYNQHKHQQQQHLLSDRRNREPLPYQSSLLTKSEQAKVRDSFQLNSLRRTFLDGNQLHQKLQQQQQQYSLCQVRPRHQKSVQRLEQQLDQSNADLVHDLSSSMMINEQMYSSAMAGSVGQASNRRGTACLQYNKPLADSSELDHISNSAGRNISQTTLRPGSSLSSRSPLHYGLYESDFDDNCEDDLNCNDPIEDPTRCTQTANMYTQGADSNRENLLASSRNYAHHNSREDGISSRPSSSCLQRFYDNKNDVENYHGQRLEKYSSPQTHRIRSSNQLQTTKRTITEPPLSSQIQLDRSRSVYFRQIGEPVEGYDLCLNRQALKARPRARSQPPANETARDAAHLTRSMDNVRKLIREVQLELDALKLDSLVVGCGGNSNGNGLRAARGIMVRDEERLREETTRRATMETRVQDEDATPTSSKMTNVSSKEPTRIDSKEIQSQQRPKEIHSAISKKPLIQKASIEVSEEKGGGGGGGFGKGTGTGTRMNGQLNQNILPSSKEESFKASDEREGKAFYEGSGSICKERQQMSSSSATRPAGQFKCVGATRKAGFLSAKKWIIKRNQSIELARKQGWKRYWVCLRGSALLFHSIIDSNLDNDEGHPRIADDYVDLLTWIQSNCPDQAYRMVDNLMDSDSSFGQNNSRQDFISKLSNCYVEREARHLILVDGSIGQPIPEHPKRDHVFCLSTAFGDAYLFQASCQQEADNWISAIHNACAAPLARNLTRDEAIRLFENHIRKLELEAEKKFFLRQRLESRLSSMCSISHLNNRSYKPLDDYQMFSIKGRGQMDEQEKLLDDQKITMRALLLRLNQQLMSLDFYLERVHCEIYQLRCYLGSCMAQKSFFGSSKDQKSDNDNNNKQKGSSEMRIISGELPHPRSLLMHVSKSSKLLLIRLGVFTVSSFHAYIHARQGSAETLLERIQLWSSPSAKGSSECQSPIKLNFLSQSISDTICIRRQQDDQVKLESDTEHLIELSNLREIPIRLSTILYCKLKGLDPSSADDIRPQSSDSSDDRYSMNMDGTNWVIINLKLHSNSSPFLIIRRILRIINSNLNELEFLNYFLQVNAKSDETVANHERSDGKTTDLKRNPYTSTNKLTSIARRTDKISDWNSFESLELCEKIHYELLLNRNRTTEESSPFGISIGAQLFNSSSDSILNVYFNYIEWGSVADKAELMDEDEILIINGSPVADLDMMYVESLMQEATKLQLLIRSSRKNPPSKASLVGSQRMRSNDEDESDDDTQTKRRKRRDYDRFQGEEKNRNKSQETQMISDEYISTLVCPPPPTQSSAFLRTDSNLLRQKSDLCVSRSANSDIQVKNVRENRLHSADSNCLQQHQAGFVMSKAKSDINFDSILLANEEPVTACINDNQPSDNQQSGATSTLDGLNRASEQQQSSSPNESDASQVDEQQSEETDPNQIERLKKSLVELLETEYAYIEHLERIVVHYLSPLEHQQYLGIRELEDLERIVKELFNFQRDLFVQLAGHVICSNRDDHSDAVNPDSLLIQVIEKVNSFKSMNDFKGPLRSIANLFISESERFKVYANYCAAYSRLQKLLHPKKAFSSYATLNGTPNGTSILPSMNLLDTFCLRTLPQGRGSSATSDSILKPLSSLLGSTNQNSNPNSSMGGSHNNDRTQLKLIKDYLSQLDSETISNSSLSSSRIWSIAKEQPQTWRVSNQNGTLKKISSKSSSSFSSSSNSSTQSDRQKTIKQNFESYLIKPIQRIVRYPMMLQSMLNCLKRSIDHNVINIMMSAIEHTESIASHVNDCQKIDEEFGPIIDNIKQLYICSQANSLDRSGNRLGSANIVSRRMSHQPSIELTIDQLLYHGPVIWLNIMNFISHKNPTKINKWVKQLNFKQTLFVFKSCVIFVCKEVINKKTNCNQSDFIEVVRYQTLIPVGEVQVRVPITSTTFHQHRHSKGLRWELIRCSKFNSNFGLMLNSNENRGKIYIFENENIETRNAFLRNIRLTIRESVKNMKIPTGNLFDNCNISSLKNPLSN